MEISEIINDERGRKHREYNTFVLLVIVMEKITLGL
jgi:hypothetical protein